MLCYDVIFYFFVHIMKVFYRDMFSSKTELPLKFFCLNNFMRKKYFKSNENLRQHSFFPSITLIIRIVSWCWFYKIRILFSNYKNLYVSIRMGINRRRTIEIASKNVSHRIIAEAGIYLSLVSSKKLRASHFSLNLILLRVLQDYESISLLCVPSFFSKMPLYLTFDSSKVKRSKMSGRSGLTLVCTTSIFFKIKFIHSCTVALLDLRDVVVLKHPVFYRKICIQHLIFIQKLLVI